MNLTLLKELEDVKHKQESLSARLAKKIETKIEHSIAEAFHDFERFFKDNGFEIQVDERMIAASYRNLSATLQYDIPEAPSAGCYFVFDLILQLQGITEYQLLLIPKSQEHVADNTAQDPNQPLRQNIEEVKASIEKTEDRIKNFSKEIWALELRLKKQKKKADRAVYDSVYEVLTALTAGSE